MLRRPEYPADAPKRSFGDSSVLRLLFGAGLAARPPVGPQLDNFLNPILMCLRLPSRIRALVPWYDERMQASLLRLVAAAANPIIILAVMVYPDVRICTPAFNIQTQWLGCGCPGAAVPRGRWQPGRHPHVEKKRRNERHQGGLHCGALFVRRPYNADGLRSRSSSARERARGDESSEADDNGDAHIM
jgi:hypothetical protein